MSVVHETHDTSVLPDALQQDQLTATIETCYDDVVTYLRHRFFSQHPEIAEDVAQETFAKVISKAHTYSGEGDMRGWIITIAFRTACDYFRKKRNTHELSTEVDLLDRPGGHESVSTLNRIALDQLFEKSGVKKDVWDAMNLLALGLTYEEVADMQDKNVSSLKTQVHRARQAFRALIERNDFLN